MPLNLILGPVGSGKTTFLLDRLRSDLENGRNPVYVTPVDFAAGELRREFIKVIGRPILGDIFVAWQDFLRKLSGENRQSSPRTELIIFIHRLLTTHKLRYFAKNMSMGIAREFAGTILTLKSNLITPDILRSELMTRGSLKENDLLTVYERYEKEKTALGIIDDGDVALAAARSLENGGCAALHEIDSVYFDEWYAIPPGAHRIIEALARSKMDVQFALPTTDNEDAPYFDLWQTNLKRLSGIAESSQYVILRCVEEVGRNDKQQPTIKVFAARSPSVEMRAIANMLAQNPDESNAVIMRPGDEYLDRLLSECERYGLLENSRRFEDAMRAPLLHKILALSAIDRLPENGDLETFAKFLTEGLKKEDSLALIRRDLKNPSTHVAAGRSSSALAHLEELIHSLAAQANTVGHDRLDRSFFAELLRKELSSSSSFSAINTHLPFALRPFDVPPTKRIRSSFIPNMTEGHIPNLSGSELFFGDMEEWGDSRSTILSEIFLGPEEKLAQEAALLDAIAAKTDHEIIFTRPLVDGEGVETAPSSFLDILPPADPVEAPPDMEEKRATRAMRSHVESAIEVEHLRQSGAQEPPQFNGIITDPKIKSMIRERFARKTLSPTSLERYASCPFVFFVEKVLSLKPAEEITPDLLPKDRGTIIHSVLEKFFRDHLDEFKRAIEKENSDSTLDKTIDKLIDEVFIEHAEVIGYASPSLDSYERRAVKTLVRQVVALELSQAKKLPEPLMPASFEWSFGEENPALTLDVPDDEPAKIGGFVDRIDTDDDKSRFMVVDYKTGRSVKSVKNRMLDGLHLQLPIYVEAVRKLLFPKAEPLGGLLFGVQEAVKNHGFLKKSYNHVNYELSGKLATLMDDEVWQDCQTKALEWAVNYVAKIRGGHFPPAPKECNDYCDYKDICRFSDSAD